MACVRGTLPTERATRHSTTLTTVETHLREGLPGERILSIFAAKFRPVCNAPHPDTPIDQIQEVGPARG